MGGGSSLRRSEDGDEDKKDEEEDEDGVLARQKYFRHIIWWLNLGDSLLTKTFLVRSDVLQLVVTCQHIFIDLLLFTG